MNKIEKKIIKQYNKNMSFFENNHPDVFEKLSILSEVLDANKYTPRFTLEYTQEEFNIYNIATKEYLYREGANDFSAKVKKTLNFKHENGFNTLHELAYSSRRNFEIDDALTNNIINSVRPYSSYINKNFPTHKKDKEFIFYKKVFILGTLLGYHIDEIIKTYSPASLLIIEPDLEIFRLSIFIYDYKKLSKKCKFFYLSVAQNNVDASLPIDYFLSNDYLQNYFIKFCISNEGYNDYLEYFAGMLQLISPLNFDYSRMIDLVKNTTTLLCQGHKFINLQKFRNNSFSDKPVLILGAGPSLKYNIEWLEKNQNKFVIVTVAAALPRLDLHNIKPDIIVSLDGHTKISDQFKLKNKDLLNDSLVLFSSLSHNDAINQSKKSNIYIYEILSRIKIDFSIESFLASNVGEVAYALMIVMKVKEIYLLGLDCSFDSKTGSSHDEVTSIGGVVKYDNSNTHKLDSNSSTIDTMDIVESKGNLRETVKLTRLFYNAVISYGNIAQRFKYENQTVYNLSDGAYFNFTNPLDPNDFDLSNFSVINKDKLKSDLKSTFEENSSPYLTLKEKNNLTKHIEFVESIILAIEEYKETKLNSLDNYESMRDSIMNTLLELELKERTYLSKIFCSYFQLIDNYINYFFNDKNLDKRLKHMKKIQLIWAKELIRILCNYRDALKM